jgi:hypothetical protein
MATNYITIKGYIKNGELKVDLPENVRDGEVDVPLTDEEIEALMRPNPKTGAEIIAAGHTGGWEHKSISDSVEWLQNRRRQRREKRGW